MTTTKAARVLVIRAERDGDYGHIRGQVSHESKSESCGFCEQRYDGDGDIVNVVINSQCDNHSTQMYGEGIAFSSYRSLDLNEAKIAVKTLEPIQRKLTKMYDTEGKAASFGAYVNRVARAIGAVKVIVATDKATRIATGNVWREVSVGDAVLTVDRMAANLIAELNPQLTAA